VFILILIGALIPVVAREWNWWVSSSALQSTDDACWEEIVALYRSTLNQPAVNIEPSLMRRRTESLLLENGY
jgi:hypothetical protein